MLSGSSPAGERTDCKSPIISWVTPGAAEASPPSRKEWRDTNAAKRHGTWASDPRCREGGPDDLQPSFRTSEFLRQVAVSAVCKRWHTENDLSIGDVATQAFPLSTPGKIARSSRLPFGSNGSNHLEMPAV